MIHWVPPRAFTSERHCFVWRQEGFGVQQPQNRWLVAWFTGYVVCVGVLFLGLPRLFAQPYLMPWDYWWVFLQVTPTAAAGLLGLSGRFSGWAVGLFCLAAVALGLWLG